MGGQGDGDTVPDGSTGSVGDAEGDEAGGSGERDGDARDGSGGDGTLTPADGTATGSDDDGEDGYADWWQVDRLDGTRLGRRELLHAHSNQPCTRSETVDVPGDVTCVVVRGHDQTHGYGGRAVLGNLETGARRSVAQGSGARSFAASDCP